jgi:hypothetical protein
MRQITVKHPAPLDERCDDCGKFLLRTFERRDPDLCAGHTDQVAV